MQSENEITMGTKNEICFAILDMVEAFESLEESKIFSAFTAILNFDGMAVITETFLCLQDEMLGKEPAEIVSGVTFPLPPNPVELLSAVRNNDLGSVQKIIGSDEDRVVLLVLLSLLTALRNSRKAMK